MTEPKEPNVGPVGEEAVKLLQALQDWAHETTAGGNRSRTSSLLNDLNEHIAAGGEDCKYCPICRLVTVARAASPEVKHHLGVAASSLLQAAAGLLATMPDGTRGHSGPVERIDLDGDNWEDED